MLRDRLDPRMLVAVRALCLAGLPVRIGLDLLWWVELGSFSLPQVLSVGIALAMGLAWLLPLPRDSSSARTLGMAWLFWVLLGGLRAESGLDALRYGLQLALPLLWVEILARPSEPRDWPMAWTVAPLLPIAISLLALLAGQPQDHVLHGWPRLLGAYGNLHSHAAAMAAFTATLLWLSLTRRQALPGIVALGASVCLLATWVRGAWLWALLALGLALVASGRIGRAIGLMGAAFAALLLVGVLRERWSEGVALLTLHPPEGGWASLGSWRIRIWTDSLSRFLEGSASQVWLGRGLGGQMGLHRHLDPHSDWLSILYQLGIPGLLLWLGWHALLVRALLRARSSLAPLALGLLVSALLVALVTNDFLFRPTPSWWTYALVGLALQPPAAAQGEDRPCGSRLRRQHVPDLLQPH